MRLGTAFWGAMAIGGAMLAGAARGGDWPAWRGPAQNGVSQETGLPDSAKEFLWRIPQGGRSTPVIYKGRVYATALSGQGVMEQEQVFAADLETGKPIWNYRFNCFHTDVPNSRVGWASPAIDTETGNIYVNGVQGLVLCLNPEGKLIWSKSLTELFGRVSGYGGRTYTPIVDEDRVIVSFNNSSWGSHAVGAQRFLAMDKRTGEIVWWCAPGGKPEDPTYSNPIVAVIGGQRLVIAGNADGSVYAIKARTGEKVWGFTASKRGLNSSPVAEGYRVFATHSEENLDNTQMGRVICIDGRGQGDVTKTHELWRADGIDAGYASPLLHEKRLYVMSNSGTLYCYDAESGKKQWQFAAGRIGKGSPVWADGKIYLTTANGTFVILRDEGTSCKKLDEYVFDIGRTGGVEIFSSPAVADGRIVFFTTTEMVCLGAKGAKPQTVAAAKLPDEAPAETTPASVVVRPAEVLLKPGETVKLQALAYDKHGRLIGPASATWAYPGKAGTLAADGQFTAGKRGGIGELTAKAGELTGTARVRIVPDLPISEDFSLIPEGEGVGWWVGVSKVKYNVATLGSTKVLKKLSDDRGPIFNRSLGFITPPIAAGYTVESDVMGVKEGRRRGDVGLVNDRYVFELFGGGKQARVMSWIPGPRFEKRVPLVWDPSRWYRLKFKVEVAGGEGKVFAKVWPSDEKEPTAWTIEASDPQPNHEGAAGIYANSTMAPVYFANVKVYRENKSEVAKGQ